MLTNITLSTMEADYISFYQSLLDTIPMTKLLMETKGNGLLTISMGLEVHCKDFEELARTLKIKPRTKYTNQVYHHFCNFVKNVRIKYFRSKFLIRLRVFSLSRYRRMTSCLMEINYCVGNGKLIRDPKGQNILRN